MDVLDATPPAAAGSGDADSKPQDATDALPTMGKEENGLQPIQWGRSAAPAASHKEEAMDVGKDHEADSVYMMNNPRRGVALIINNREFDRKTGMGARNGTDIDAANLYQTFKRLGFESKLVNNLTCSRMLIEVQNVSKRDHSDVDCFVMCVLSHGDEGVIYGTDGILPVDAITSPFKGERCPSLIGKPKLFFIQACRGSQLDHGVIESDSDAVDSLPRGRRIPQEADVLMAFSTVPGFYSWRNSSKGSWFVQALCKVMAQYGETHEIMSMMTKVNHKVAYEFESSASNPAMSEKKQIPCMMSMLTRDLYFHPKK